MTINHGKKTKTVLMVDYFFPPIAGAGVQRTLGYTRHLSEFGWEPVVLTVQSGEHSFYDSSLLEKIPNSVEVQRTLSIEPIRFVKGFLNKSRVDGNGLDSTHRAVEHQSSRAFRGIRNLERWILFPDRRVGWLPFAVSKAVSMSRDRTFDVIYSTSTAITSHLVAYTIKRLLRKPWVADFQDPWAAKIDGFPTPMHRGLAERLELLILQGADRVTVTSSPLRQMFLDRDPHIPAEKVVMIPMGFDPDAFDGLEVPTRSKFTVTHFGTFYGPRSPIPFLAALSECLRKRPCLGEDIEVLLFGQWDPQLLALTSSFLDQRGLRQIVHIMGTVQYAIGLRHLLGASVLLLVTDPGSWGKDLIPSKIFEYLAAGRPILALVPEGATAEIMTRAAAGLVVEPDNIHAISDAILELHCLWKGRRLTFSPNQDLIQTFTWRELTRRFAATLGEALAPS